MRRRSSWVRPHNVLVIYKKSNYQRLVKERRNARAAQLLEAEHPTVSRWMAAHEAHVATLEQAKVVLDKLGVKAAFRYRSDPGRAEDFDMVITLGGDGTLLWASRLVGSQPMLAVNTAPDYSVGYFCAGTKNNLEEVLTQALSGELRETKLTRMRVSLDGEVVSNRVLNDVLFCHGSPAATTRYLIEHRGTVEDHKSSGVWVGPGAGSTAAQRSAGGRVLSPTSKKLQFVVREPYMPNGDRYELVRGLIEPDEELIISNKVHGARIFVDGPQLRRDVELGSELRMGRSDEPLNVLGFRNRSER